MGKNVRIRATINMSRESVANCLQGGLFSGFTLSEFKSIEENRHMLTGSMLSILTIEKYIDEGEIIIIRIDGKKCDIIVHTINEAWSTDLDTIRYGVRGAHFDADNSVFKFGANIKLNPVESADLMKLLGQDSEMGYIGELSSERIYQGKSWTLKGEPYIRHTLVFKDKQIGKKSVNINVQSYSNFLKTFFTEKGSVLKHYNKESETIVEHSSIHHFHASTIYDKG